ncbi:MAG: hypothetical protein AAGA77_20450 [Bacteroidota bacterium]
MPNYFHFVVKVKSVAEVKENAGKEISNASTSFQNGESDLNSFVLDQYRRFFSSYALSYNFRHKHRGQVFLKKFKRVTLNVDTRLHYMICYVHHNPIHHRFRKNYTSWEYSSIHQYIHNNINEHYKRLLTTLFKTKVNFIQIHKEFKINMKESLNLD